MEGDLTNTRTTKNHFPEIVHKIARRENINCGQVILSIVTIVSNITFQMKDQHDYEE